MARDKVGATVKEVREALATDPFWLRQAVQDAVQQVLEEEMAETLAASKGERTAGRQGYRRGYHDRSLVTRVGTLELRVPQDRKGLFSTAVFDRYQRSEKALFTTLAEMYVCGVSTRSLIRHVYDVDPLVCPRWQLPMKIIAFITDQAAISAILATVHRAASPVPSPSSRPPPPPARPGG